MFYEPKCMLFYMCNIFYHIVEKLSIFVDIDMIGKTILKPCTYVNFYLFILELLSSLL